jgi:hypothetical protein
MPPAWQDVSGFSKTLYLGLPGLRTDFFQEREPGGA